MTDDIQRGSRWLAPTWTLGRTRSIRVPIVLADTLLQIARRLDNGELADSVINLTMEDKREMGEA